MVKSSKKSSPEPQLNDVYDMTVAQYSQYHHDYILALREVNTLKRQLSRAEHSVKRIKMRLDQIEEYCKNNNIPLDKGL